MPRKATKRRTVRGKGLKDWLKKANNWLKKTGVVSKVANALGTVGVPYASSVGKVAGSLGYGRKRRGRRTGRKTIRGRGNGHLNNPNQGYGIAGTTVYSPGLFKL